MVKARQKSGLLPLTQKSNTPMRGINFLFA
jgi:hypothetical protein